MLKPIELAIGEIGYLEKASNKNLDSKALNPGDANITKYARDLDAINWFNGKKQGAQWCATFVNWLFVTAYGADTARKMLYQTGKLAASCTYAAGYYKTAGAYYTKPQAGDQIFFGNSSGYSHTGIVEKFDKEYVYTIEGNTSDSTGVVSNGGGVWRKKYLIDYSRIKGYGRPNWSLVQSETDEAIEWITSAGIMLGNSSGDLMLDQPITRKQFAVMLYRYDQQKK